MVGPVQYNHLTPAENRNHREQKGEIIMPKVIYDSDKGLYQTTGTGFQVNDVAILEEVQSLTDPSAATVNAYGITTLTKTAACTATLAAPTSSEPAGAKKVMSMIAASGAGACVVTLTGGGIQDDGATALASLSFNAVGETAVLISNGTKWVAVAIAGATEG